MKRYCVVFAGVVMACSSTQTSSNAPPPPARAQAAAIVDAGIQGATATATHDAAPTNCYGGPNIVGPFEGLDFARDPRCAVQPRPRAILETELSMLGEREKSLAKKDPARAELLRKLDDGYIELARHEGRGTEAAAALFRTSIQYADVLLTEFPNAPQRDEVLYYRGFAQERAGQTAVARKSFGELIQRYPASTFTPCARMMAGETWMVDAIVDKSKLQFSVREFRECVKIPPEKNACHRYAAYYLETVPYFLPVPENSGAPPPPTPPSKGGGGGSSSGF